MTLHPLAFYITIDGKKHGPYAREHLKNFRHLVGKQGVEVLHTAVRPEQLKPLSMPIHDTRPEAKPQSLF